MPTVPHTALPKGIAAYAERLQELPFVRAVRASESTRGTGRISGATALSLDLTDDTSKILMLEVKTSHLSADAAQYLRAGLFADRDDWLVVAPYIGAPLGETLEADGINFIDRSGNCHLSVGDRFVARVQGRPRPKREPANKSMRAAGYQVLFALLSDPDLVSAPQRDIAFAAGTSRQPVADLLARLRAERILVKKGRAFAWVDGPDEELLRRWLEGYRTTVRHKLLVGRFALPVSGPQQVEEWLHEHADHVFRYGGNAGAYRLEPHFRGALTMAHLGEPSEVLRRELKAMPDQSGELIWMRHIGEASKQGETIDAVHPLLIYSELAIDPDPRAAEAAELIRERYLSWSL